MPLSAEAGTRSVFVRLGILILLATFAVASPVLADTGAIIGRVTDTTGAALPDVTVTAQNVATGSDGHRADGQRRAVRHPGAVGWTLPRAGRAPGVPYRRPRECGRQRRYARHGGFHPAGRRRQRNADSHRGAADRYDHRRRQHPDRPAVHCEPADQRPQLPDAPRAHARRRDLPRRRSTTRDSSASTASGRTRTTSWWMASAPTRRPAPRPPPSSRRQARCPT